MMSKYGEPWVMFKDTSDPHGYTTIDIEDADGTIIAIEDHEKELKISTYETIDNFKRIVSCVNALSGIDDPKAQVEKWRGADLALEKIVSDMKAAYAGPYQDFLKQVERWKRMEEAHKAIKQFADGQESLPQEVEQIICDNLFDMYET